MRNCILHVTDREFPRILQLNHDGLLLRQRDEELMEGLVRILGIDVVDQIRDYDQCRVQAHHSLDGLPRIEEDAAEPAEMNV
jgi:hypothetical protein